MGIVEISNPSPFPSITKQPHFAFRVTETRFGGGILFLKKDESTAMCVSVTTNMTKCRFSWERPLRRKQEYCNADGLDLLQILTNLSAGILFLTRLCYTTGSFEIELQIYLKSI